jgi:AbrB family looped-hinge helix DNA binding protein
MQTTVLSRGRVTLPKELLARLGIRAGDQLVFEEEAGRLVIRKALGAPPCRRLGGIGEQREQRRPSDHRDAGSPEGSEA